MNSNIFYGVRMFLCCFLIYFCRTVKVAPIAANGNQFMLVDQNTHHLRTTSPTGQGFFRDINPTPVPRSEPKPAANESGDVGHWPFKITLMKDGHFNCVGAIINEYWIISAAKCLENASEHYFEIHAGLLHQTSFETNSTSYAPEMQIAKVLAVIVNNRYDPNVMVSDVSLLRLETPLLFNQWVRPICLPSPERVTSIFDPYWSVRSVPDGTCTIVKWEALSEGDSIPDSMEEVNGYDACQGYSGAPIFCRSVADPNEFYLQGIVSHGEGCAGYNERGVYTRIALYIEWIDKMIHSDLSVTAQSTKNKCPGFNCIKSNYCISELDRCNGRVDCLGGEDELNCPDTNSPKRVGHQNADFELPNENGNSDIQRKEIVSSTSIGRALITSANIKTTTMSETSTDAFITKYSTTDEINYFTTDAGPTEKTDTQNSTNSNLALVFSDKVNDKGRYMTVATITDTYSFYVHIKIPKEQTRYLRRENIHCSGFMVSPTHVISAAHCFSEMDKILLPSVHFSNGIFIKAKTVITHENFIDNGIFFENDIAILELIREAPRIVPIKLGCKSGTHNGFMIAPDGNDKKSMTSSFFEYMLKASTKEIGKTNCGEEQFITCVNLHFKGRPDAIGKSNGGDSGSPLCEIKEDKNGAQEIIAVGVLSYRAKHQQKKKDSIYKINKWYDMAFINIDHFYDWLPAEITTPKCESTEITTTTIQASEEDTEGTSDEEIYHIF